MKYIFEESFEVQFKATVSRLYLDLGKRNTQIQKDLLKKTSSLIYKNRGIQCRVYEIEMIREINRRIILILKENLSIDASINPIFTNFIKY